MAVYFYIFYVCGFLFFFFFFFFFREVFKTESLFWFCKLIVNVSIVIFLYLLGALHLHASDFLGCKMFKYGKDGGGVAVSVSMCV